MAKITTESILCLDLRVEGNEKLLKKALTKTKWLEKYTPEELTMDLLERLYRKVTKKYPGYIGYVQNAGDDSWSFMIKHSETHAWIVTVYARTLYEGLAKTLLAMHGHFIKGMPFHDKKD